MVTGYAHGIDATKITRLEDKVEESAKRLARDVDLFDEGGVVLCILVKTLAKSLYKSP